MTCEEFRSVWNREHRYFTASELLALVRHKLECDACSDFADEIAKRLPQDKASKEAREKKSQEIDSFVLRHLLTDPEA